MLKVRSSFILIFLLFSSHTWATAPVAPPPGYFQCNVKAVELKDITPELISLSEFILEGTLISPTSLIKKNLLSKKHEYVLSNLVHVKSLKGNIQTKKIAISNFTREEPYGVCVKNLFKTNKQKVIVFLVKPDEFKEGYFFFAGYSPNALSKFTKEKSKYIQETLVKQERLLATFDEKFEHIKNNPLYVKVQELINRALLKKYQQSAFDELTKLGKPAIPSIVMQMDDYRPLPNTVTMSPNYLHYGPEVVVDELSTILSFLTGKHLSSIYNGGSARERKHTINAWRLYLASSKNKI